MTDEEKPRRAAAARAKRRLLGLAGSAASLLVLVLALLHAPPVARAVTRAALARASAALGCRVEAGSVRWNLLAGTLDARDVALRGERERAGTEISAALVRVDLSLPALLRGRTVVEEARLERPAVRLALDGKGRLVLPFALPEETEEPTGRPDVEVLSLRLTDGRVELSDRGPGERVVAADGIAIEGSVALRALRSKGSLSVRSIEVSARDVEPLRGSTLTARWETKGDVGTAAARLDAPEAGLVVAADARFRGLSGTPSWEARLAAKGSLEPLASRLAPELGLSGTVDASAVASAAGATLPVAAATLRADDVTLLGRAFDRVDAGLELDGALLRKGTLSVAAGKGRLRAEVAGTIRPILERLRFSARAEGLDVGRLVLAGKGGPRLGGTLDGTVEGTLARPELAALEATADLALRGSVAARGAVLAPDAHVRARVAGGVVTVETATLAERATRAALSGRYDHRRRAFEGTLEASTTDVGPWLALFGLEAKGSLDVDLAGGGPLGRPALDGRLRARGLVVAGARIDCVDLDARSNGARFSVENGIAAAWGAEAGFAAEGTLPLPGEKTPSIDLRVRGARFRGRLLPDLDAHADLGRDRAFRLRSSDGSVSAHLEAPAGGDLSAGAALDRFDLAPLAPLLAPWVDGFGGTVTARLDATRPRRGTLAATLSVEEADLLAAGRRLSAAGAVARLDRGLLSIDRLELRGDDGSHVSASGTATLDGSVLDLAARFEVPELAAWQGLLPLPAEGTERPPFEGRLSGDLRSKGTFDRPGLTGELRASGLRAFGVGLDRADVALAPREDGSLVADVSLADLSFEAVRVPAARLGAVLSGDALAAEGSAFDDRLRVKANASLAGARPFDATVVLDALDLSPFLRPAGVPGDLSATTTGTVRIRGAGTDERALSVDAELTAFEAKGPRIDARATEPVRVAYDGSGLAVRSLRLEGPGLSVKASGSLPARGGPAGRIALDSSLDLSLLLPFVDALDRASGRLSAALEVTGSLSDPRGVGTVTVEEALLDGPDFPVPFEKVSGTLVAERGTLRTEGLSARVGTGSVVLAGVLREEDGVPKEVDATLKARDLDLEYGKDVQLLAGADLTAKGAWSSVLVAGEVRLDEVVWVPAVELTGILKSLKESRTRRSEERKGAPSRWVPGLTFDVALLAKDAIRVEGIVGEAELGGTLRLKGTPEAPVVVGSIASSRGSINLFGSVFDLSRCKIDFSDPLAIDPDLDVVATTTKGDEEITIRIDGRASKTQLLLSSSKGRSQADIVSVLLGGSGTGSGSELSAAAAKMAVRGAASPILGSLGTHTDLEIVPLPTTPEGEEFLFSVGKDLGGGVSATYYKGVSGETTDAIEMKWRLSSRARGRLRQNQDGSLSGGFRIRHDLD